MFSQSRANGTVLEMLFVQNIDKRLEKERYELLNITAAVPPYLFSITPPRYGPY